MSGQGWDKTNSNTSESKAEGRLFASPQRITGCLKGRTDHAPKVLYK